MTGWLQTLHDFRNPRVLAMLFLGFSAGLPLLLIFSTLSLWLREAGIDRGAVTYFSWAALAYSFKFVWSPLVDKLPLPFLHRLLGKRRSWLLLAQLMVMAAMIWMAMNDPATASGLHYMAFAAVLLGFSSATQDIVIDAYRIEAVQKDMQALMSATYVAGYRVGMIVAGAVALYLAEWLGTTKDSYLYAAWQMTYIAMAAAMLIGVATTLSIREPEQTRESSYIHGPRDYFRFLLLFAGFVLAIIFSYLVLADPVETIKSGFAQVGDLEELAAFMAEALRLLIALAMAILTGWVLVRIGVADQRMLRDTYIDPVADFFQRYGKAAVLILLLVGFYRVSDILLGVISNVFYQDMGFSKDQIATVTKVFGIWMTIFGGFLGGFLTLRFGVIRVLMLGAVMTVVTNLLFIPLANHPGDVLLLYVVIGADNITAGLASAAFIAYLSSLTSLSFTAVQYAIFSSLMTLFPKLLGGYSGSIVDAIGYQSFFLAASMIGVPVFLLVWLAGRYTRVKQE
ncbi:MAG: MFS transporter [Chromatiales bacterium]|jgi:PAT family beta-lactamase induction signal transducer AmpG